MNFSTDRDLLVYEPTLFHDVPWASQQRVRVNDAVTSTTQLTSDSGEFDLDQVGVGGVVLIEGTAYEILRRLNSTTLTVSRLRGRLTDEPIPVPSGTDQTAVVRTFEPQATVIHDELLWLLGLTPADPDSELSEQAIISLAAMARVEALGTLERIFSGAAALTGDNETLYTKASEYKRRFNQGLTRTTVLFDADEDGRVDARRRFDAPRLVRV